MSYREPGAAGTPDQDLPARRVTGSQLVAFNMAQYRKAAGIGQAELGAPLGWSSANVSAAERSWDGRRVRRFDADEVVRIALALDIPVVALFLPPPDAGIVVRYVLADEQGAADVMDLLPRLLAAHGDSRGMTAFRDRLMALGASRHSGEADAGALREELEKRIGDLRDFEREYRQRLLACLEGQLASLRTGDYGGDSAEAAGHQEV